MCTAQRGARAYAMPLQQVVCTNPFSFFRSSCLKGPGILLASESAKAAVAMALAGDTVQLQHQ